MTDRRFDGVPMEEQVPNAVLAIFGTAALLSFSALFYLFQKHIDARPLLRYQPRKCVPWGVGIAVLAISMPLANVFVFLAAQSEPGAQDAANTEETADAEANGGVGDDAADDEPNMDEQVANSWGTFVFMLAFVFGVGMMIVALYQADVSDFGLPSSWSQAWQDIGIGILATLAALLPVYVVQLVLITALDEKTKHPLVEQLEANPSSAMLTVGIAMAVIAAPLFEEFTFRCLLQGWLEKVEDTVVGYHATSRNSDEIASNGEEQNGEAQHDEHVQYEHVNAHQYVPKVLAVDTPPTTNHSPPPHGLIPALPHGWTPILISGTVFGLAHLGHGVAPISLILFGIVLAYLYQRTHRLLPSITAHMVFNGYSMLLLWLQLNR
ncbi:MAG: CPBP family intramembrane glutamic endopeptidase [Planctomycetota bacterium]